ncbi:CCCH-type zinc fingerfamily protein with RNA-binding domain-containing protein [Actinidia rufa]|uniref:CCCH-type zinc fingerfamily protein with RNA-binding domain-containing protein n=1 Tax=Actinidia rufa TaxID=165716 RepID=A0A7J0FSG9_9ERIC|nr:CCCH-type zinc fingerfamily protein with RNA-binding domain-containing protein [Actinidia rufa]
MKLLNKAVTEQDLRDYFYAHGEIEAVRMVLQRACAFVTYTTREGAEKAAEELSNKLVVKGLRLKLMWGRPQAPKPETEGSDGARQQAAVAHSGMLPRAVISQQQNQLQPPGTQDQPPPMHYFNIPPPPQQDRTFLPINGSSKNGCPRFHLRRGLLVGPQGLLITKPIQRSNNQCSSILLIKLFPPGQFHQPFYPPPYGYMPPPPPPYQQYPPPPYHPTMAPTHAPPPMPQQYQHSDPPGLSQK